MKISLQDLKIKVKAKADTFGKYSPADINCDELLWLIAQLEAAEHTLAGGRLQLVRVFDESEVEETGVGEYQIKSAAAKA